MMSVPAKGWYGRVLHPVTDRVLLAKPLSDPRIEPSINSLPAAEFPVPSTPQWQEEFTREPDFEVYLDGQEQPIDELVVVGDGRQDASKALRGRGGVELLETTDVEFDAKRRHLAAQQVIQNNTTYTADVDEPDSPVLADQDAQNPTTQSELAALITIADDVPLELASGGVKTVQSCFTVEAEDFDSQTNTDQSDSSAFSGDGVSDGNGRGQQIDDTGRLEWQFTPNHRIPASDFGLAVRSAWDGGAPPGVDWSISGPNLSGEEALISRALIDASVQWYQYHTEPQNDTWTEPSADLLAGNTYTIIAETQGLGSDDCTLDVLAPYDTRYDHFFDETLTDGADGGRYLDGPETQPDAVFAVFDPFTTPFQAFAGSVTVTMDDTSNDQQVQLRNQVDGTWKPDDGTEDNTTSVTVDPFDAAGDRIQLRVTLSRHSENGARDQTPRLGYTPQELTAYDLDVDIRQESLLLDYRENKRLTEILTDIVGDELFWSYRVVDGTSTVTVTQPGLRTSDRDPQLLSADIDKDLEVIHRAEVPGANKSVDQEQFVASTSFVSLTEDDIVAGSEVVVDPADGTQFTREEDYRMDYSAGEIKITEDGPLVDGNTYDISYNAERRGTFEASDAPTDFRTLTVEIPEVTSQRNAEQVAFVLVNDLQNPRWIGDITVPPGVTDFDVVEALPLDRLGLPADAGPFFIAEPPRETPRGIQFRLESQPDQQRRIAQLKRQVAAVVSRTD